MLAYSAGTHKEGATASFRSVLPKIGDGSAGADKSSNFNPLCISPELGGQKPFAPFPALETASECGIPVSSVYLH